jgi:hypothetical protein
LLQSSVNALFRFFSQIPNEIGSNDRLNVCGQTPTSRIEIQRLISEVHFGATIYDFAKVSPVFEVPRTPVNLVHDHSGNLPAPKDFEHPCPHRPASFCGCLLFFKPIRNRQIEAGRISLNRSLLFEQRNSLSLPRSGDSDVTAIVFENVYRSK